MKGRELFLNLYSYSKGDYLYIREISNIVIKSLLPLRNSLGVKIDYRRFREEVKLWKYYGDIRAKSLLYASLNKSDLYMKEDMTIYSRILPIVLANNNLDLIVDQVLENILFTTGSVDSIFDGIFGAVFFYKYINSQEIVEGIKEVVINLSLIDIIDSKLDSFRFIDPRDKLYKIRFEEARIEFIKLLDRGRSDRFIFIQDLLNTIEGQEARTIYSRALERAMEEEEGQTDSQALAMADYLELLRKGRISPENLYIENYQLPDIREKKPGDSFYHSLFKECKILEVDKKGKEKTWLVETRSGRYLFKDRLF